MVTPTFVAASLQTLLGVSLTLPRTHDARGWGIIMLLAGSFAAIAHKRNATPRTRARASASLSVVLAFAPALLFPAITPLLLSAVTFLLHWLAGSAGRSGCAAASRLDLVADLGFLPIAPRADVSGVGTGVDADDDALPRLEAPLGLLSLAIAAPLVAVELSSTGTVPGVRAGLFLLASIASWEQAFRRFASVSSSDEPSPTPPRATSATSATSASSTSTTPPSPSSSSSAPSR